MAQKGTYTAYQQYTPLQVNGYEFAQAQQDDGYRRRQEQRLEDQLEEQRAAKAQAKKDALRSKMLGQIPKNFDSGSKSLNELQGNIIQQGANRLVEIYDQLGDPAVSESDKLKLQLEAQNIENLPDNLKLATSSFQNKIQDYQKGVADGSYFRDPNFENLTMAGFEKYVGGLDNGLPTVGFADTNQDGVIDIADVVSFDEIQAGIPQFQFQKQYDLDKMAAEQAKVLGTKDDTKDSGFVSRRIKGPNIEALNVITDRLFVNPDPDRTPTDFALSELRKRGLNPDESGMNEIKQAYKERVLANIDTIDETKRDYSAETSRMSERRQARKDNEKSKVTWGVVETPPAYTDSGQNSARGYKTIAVQGKTSIPSLEYYEGSKKETLTNPSIQSYTVRKNANGQRYIVAEVVNQESKGSTLTPQEELILEDPEVPQPQKDLIVSKVTVGAQNKPKVVPLTEKDAKIFALQMGFKDVNEMKDAAKVGEEDPKETGEERALRILRER